MTRCAAGPVTYARVSTDDVNGIICAYTGEGELTNDPLDTFGHRAVIHTPGLQNLLTYLCKNGFGHHVAMTMNHVAPVLSEAFETYMGGDVYHHGSKNQVLTNG
jgi:L-fucose isomerase-like protein